MLWVLIQRFHKVCLIDLHGVVVVAEPLTNLLFEVLLLAQRFFKRRKVNWLHILADRYLDLLELVLQFFIFVSQLLHLFSEVVDLERLNELFVLFNLLVFVFESVVLGL